MYITYNEKYKSVTELLFESRNMLNELKNQCIKLSDEKEKLIMENINLRDEVKELSAEVQKLKENQWGMSFANS